MKVLVAQEPGLAKYVNLPKPEAKGDSVVVKVKACGICATDISILRGDAPFMHDGSTTYPVRFGHEWSGIVESVGEKVTKFKPGDKVISDSGVSCGVCKACTSGHFRECKHSRAVGTINAWPGGFAEYVGFPERHLYRVPDHVSYEAAAAIEPGAIALGGVMYLNIKRFPVVLIVGTGAIGQCAVAFAKHEGATVVLAGRSKSKLEVGEKLGADYTFSTRDESISSFIGRNFGGRVGSILECSGNIEVMDDLIDVLDTDGMLALAGFFEKSYKNFDIDKFIMRRAYMAGVMGGWEATVKSLEGVSDGVDLTPMITRRIDFDSAGEVMMKMMNEGSSDVKVMVEF